MELYFYKDRIEFVEYESGGFLVPPRTLLVAYKLADISEEMFSRLTDEQTDKVYYFFWDLSEGG